MDCPKTNVLCRLQQDIPSAVNDWPYIHLLCFETWCPVQEVEDLSATMPLLLSGLQIECVNITYKSRVDAWLTLIMPVK